MTFDLHVQSVPNLKNFHSGVYVQKEGASADGVTYCLPRTTAIAEGWNTSIYINKLASCALTKQNLLAFRVTSKKNAVFPVWVVWNITI